jgi:pyruvate,water dikinase
MCSLIWHGDGPSAEELAQRARYRAEASFADAPPVLGDEPGAPLPAEWLPPAAARMEQAVGAYLGAVFMAPEVRSEAQKVRGLAVSPGVYEGSHAAIVSREYGIPSIVGCIDATARIPDNARVRVDGNTGEAVIVA